MITSGGSGDAVMMFENASGNTWGHGLDLSSGNYVIGYNASGDPSLTSEGKLNITSEGKVGIGHTSPQFGLTLAQSSNNSGAIGWEDGSNSKRASIRCETGADSLMFATGTSDTERMRIDSNGRVMVGLTGTPQTASLATLTGGNSSSYAYMFIAGGSVSNYKMLKAGGKFITRGVAERNIDLVQAVQCSGNMNILITVKFKLNSAVNGNSGEILCQAKMSATSSGNWNYAVKTPQLTNHFSSGYGTDLFILGR